MNSSIPRMKPTVLRDVKLARYSHFLWGLKTVVKQTQVKKRKTEGLHFLYPMLKAYASFWHNEHRQILLLDTVPKCQYTVSDTSIRPSQFFRSSFRQCSTEHITGMNEHQEI